MKMGWVALPAVCIKLRLPHQSAQRLLHVGVLRGEKIGGRWFIDPASVREAERLLRLREQAAVR